MSLKEIRERSPSVGAFGLALGESPLPDFAHRAGGPVIGFGADDSVGGARR